MLIPAKTTITSSDWCNGARKDRKENVGWSGGGPEGFSISYDRVMNLRSSMSNQEPGVHGVPSQRSGLSCWFKTECVHSSYYWQSRPNPSSATAESSFHGTTISVFQHADYHLSFPVSSDIDVDWCHWLHVSLLLTKLFLNSGIAKTGMKISKEDFQLQRTGLPWLSLKCYSFHLYIICVNLTLVLLWLHLRQCCHG